MSFVVGCFKSPWVVIIIRKVFSLDDREGGDRRHVCHTNMSTWYVWEGEGWLRLGLLSNVFIHLNNFVLLPD